LFEISQGILHLSYGFYADMIPRERSSDGLIHAARIKRNASCARRPNPSASDANTGTPWASRSSKGPGTGWPSVNSLSKTIGDGKIDIFLWSLEVFIVWLPLWNLFYTSSTGWRRLHEAHGCKEWMFLAHIVTFSPMDGLIMVQHNCIAKQNVPDFKSSFKTTRSKILKQGHPRVSFSPISE
jgi:hypothetical protein